MHNFFWNKVIKVVKDSKVIRDFNDLNDSNDFNDLWVLFFHLFGVGETAHC